VYIKNLKEGEEITLDNDIFIWQNGDLVLVDVKEQ
jgi:hypothetical protein